MSSDTKNGVESVEEWKAGTLSLALLCTAFPILVGSHIVAGRYLSVPWLLPEAEGALIGIPVSLLLYLSVSKILGIPNNAVFIRKPDRSNVRWVCYGITLVAGVVTGAIVFLPGTLRVDVGGLRFLSTVLLSAVLLGLLAAITEELVFRGYVLSFVGHHWGWTKAIILTSLLFGLLHNGKVESTAASELYVLIAASAGLLYALVTYYTENIWNAVGLHAIWNTAFHARVLSFEPAKERTDSAIVSYEYADSGYLFGSDWAAVTGSPFVLLLLVAASVAVLITYDKSFKYGGAKGNSLHK